MRRHGGSGASAWKSGTHEDRVGGEVDAEHVGRGKVPQLLFRLGREQIGAVEAQIPRQASHLRLDVEPLGLVAERRHVHDALELQHLVERPVLVALPKPSARVN